ncbi:cGMP-dependent 3',5'-cyclic phosphodiesterase [Anabrus simplex]|uniref:cGMP-dependent 3',5'-cyclic phosphodiesterase n=1 Tax=Anabrus simplex TaxID=316456 RepID=UPI0034DCCD02
MSTMKLHVSDPASLLKLCSTLHDKNSVEIQIKVNKYLQEQTEASLVFLVPLFLESEEAVIQVLGTKQLEREMRFPVTNNALNVAVKRRCSIASPSRDLNRDLQDMIRTVISPVPDTFLNVPVPHPKQGTIALLVCIVNYADRENAEFICSELVLECFRFCLGTVLNTVAYEEEKRLKKQCQSLLSVARNLFSRLGNMSDLLREIMTEARKLTNAERCSLFLVDHDHNELVAKVFDGELSNQAVKEVRLSINQGIAGHVAATGELLNIRNAYSHPLFYRGIDEATGFRTRNLLCFPIRKEDVVIGVAELCNKNSGYCFDVFDEEVAMAFSIYCGISIMHSIVYKNIQDAQLRSKVSNELMMYHMKVSDDDVRRVSNCQLDHTKIQIDNFSFSPRMILLTDTPCFVLRMLDDLGLIQHFRIKREPLIRFIMFVKKGYRDTPYHNWMHAFSVTHFAYVLIKNLNLIDQGYITQLDALALMISCACHDLDHRGTTNAFQMQSCTVLASLYSSEGSVMERHHLSQTLCILNTEHCNFLDCLSPEQYSKCLDLIRDMILATDLAQHIRIFAEQQEMLNDGYDKNNEKHKRLLLSLLMTCSDLSDQTKDWKTSKKIAEMIYEEFFKQGDMEKSMGNNPLEMMDRDKARIPELQIQFLSDIVIPVFQLLAQLFPPAKCLVEATEINLQCWSRATNIFLERWPKGHSSMEILTDPDFEKEVLELLNFL